MSPVDGLDTMILMGMTDEAAQTREYIVKNLSFDRDIYVKNFEITIRLLGGLLSSYQLTGDKRLLALADDLGTRLLPAFNSPTGMPYVFVNLKTGAVRGEVHQSCRSRHSAHRIRHAQQTDRETHLLRKSETRTGRTLQPPFAHRPGRLDHQYQDRASGSIPSATSAEASTRTTNIC